MAGKLTPGVHPDPQDRRLERAGRFLAGSFGALAIVVGIALLSRPLTLLDLAILALVLTSAGAALLYWRAAGDLELRRRSEVEGFARILQGLSRSVSPDAIVEAIAEELGVAAGADHVVIVRLRPNSGLLEATLVTNRAGVPSSTTVLPLSDLEDPLGPVRIESTWPIAVGPGPLEVAAPRRSEAAVPARGRAHTPDSEGLAHGPARTMGDPTWAGYRAIALATGHGGAAVSQVGGVGRDIDAGPERAHGEPDWTRGGMLERTLGAGASDPVLGAAIRPSVRAPGAGARGGGRSAAAGANQIADQLATRVRSVYGLKHTIVAPLTPGNAVVGAIVLSRRTGDDWPVASGRLLHAAAIEASAALDRAYSHRAAEERAATDALTGLPNRRYFDEYVSLFARRRRSGDAVGILMIDIDNFKRLNDRFGHATGDAVLKRVAGAIVSAVREDDVPARFGGEEFVVLLRNPGTEVAAEVGERVRQAVRRLDLSDLGVPGVTVSVGVSIEASPDQPIGAVVEQADQAMYRAKRGGRNRVVAA